MQDAVKHGTHACLLKLPRKNSANRANKKCKLTVEQVLEIRRRAATKTETQKSIAKDYPVSYTTINHIILGTDWREMPPEVAAT
jgi:hypothetical protein